MKTNELKNKKAEFAKKLEEIRKAAKKAGYSLFM